LPVGRSVIADRLLPVVDRIAAARAAAAEEAVRRVETLLDEAADQPDGYECEFISTRLLRDALAGELR
jgi:hypothetical protein